jgi:hypothetical protein
MLHQGNNIGVHMKESREITGKQLILGRGNILGTVCAGDQSVVAIASQSNVDTINQGIHMYDLLDQAVEHVAQPPLVASFGMVVMVVEVEFLFNELLEGSRKSTRPSITSVPSFCHRLIASSPATWRMMWVRSQVADTLGFKANLICGKTLIAGLSPLTSVS